MEIFISWSGSRSKAVAEALDEWVSQVIQAVTPWRSTDIEKGKRWGPEITQRLEKARVGIICLTPENLSAPWISFEAGALSKTNDAHVCTFLLDLTPSDVSQPLAQFQHTLAQQDDIRSLLHTVNARVREAGEHALSEDKLNRTFDKYWPELNDKLNDIAARKPTSQPPARKDRELLEEILELTRSQVQQYSPQFRRSTTSATRSTRKQAAAFLRMLTLSMPTPVKSQRLQEAVLASNLPNDVKMATFELLAEDWLDEEIDDEGIGEE